MAPANEESSKCPTCRDENPGVRAPRLVAWAVTAIAWTAILLTGSALAILIPINLVLIPCWLIVGSSLGPLARELFDPKCQACASPRGFSSTGPAHVSWRSTRPANKRAVESGLVREA
jgi:hypothetical protein